MSARFFKCIYQIVVLVFLGAALTSCLEVANKDQAKSLAATAGFSGVIAAKNVNGPIEIRWETLSSAKLIKVYRQIDGEFQMISSVNPTVNAYIDGTVDAGGFYTYKVEAVMSDGSETDTGRLASALSYPGVLMVSSVQDTSVTVLAPSVSGAVSKLRVTATPLQAGVPPTSLEFDDPSLTSLTIPNLQSGIKYNFKVEAYSEELEAYDGNTVIVSGQTYSSSFSDFDGDTVYRYRGFSNVEAYGDAPNAPSSVKSVNVSDIANFILGAPTTGSNSLARQPKIPTVRVSWRPFSGATSSTVYKVVRSYANTSLDLGVVADSGHICMATTTTSCVVCVVKQQMDSGSPVANACEDISLMPAPAKYQYAVTQVLTNSTTGVSWSEELPSDATMAAKQKITVEIPPLNMALVHRNAANMHLCSLLRKTDLAIDPLNNNRCLYAGQGATTVSAGPGKPALNLTPGYFDFGYNLFVDRWEAGCNWSRSTAGNVRCGRADSGCIGSTDPTTLGITPSAGDIFYNVANGMCYYPNPGNPAVWTTGSTEDDTQMLFTNDPQSDHKTPPAYVPQYRAWLSCLGRKTPDSATSSLSSYSGSRLPRFRESRIFAMPPWLDGDTLRVPISSGVPQFDIYTGAVGHNIADAVSYRGCNTNILPFTTLPDGDPLKVVIPALGDIAANLAPSNYIFRAIGATLAYVYTGSPFTADCVSRYGIQDTGTNVPEYSSDRLKVRSDSTSATESGRYFVGLASYDTGSRELDGYKVYMPDGTNTFAQLLYNSFAYVDPVFLLSSPTANSNTVLASTLSGIPYLNPGGSTVVNSATILRTFGWGWIYAYSPDPTIVYALEDGEVPTMDTNYGRGNPRVRIDYASSTLGFRCVMPTE